MRKELSTRGRLGNAASQHTKLMAKQPTKRERLSSRGRLGNAASTHEKTVRKLRPELRP